MATGKLYNIGHISSNVVSGGTIRFTQFAGTTDATATQIETLTAGGDATSLHTHTGLSAKPGGEMTANVGGGDPETGVFNFGISGLRFMSSQTISGGAIYGTWAGKVIGDSFIGGQYSNWLSSGEKISRWLYESSQKISIFVDSGNEYSDLYTWYGGSVSSSQYPNWLASGEKLSRWFVESSGKIGESSQKYTDLYTWYGVAVSSAQYPNWLASGEKLSRWFKESSARLGEFGASGDKYSNWYMSGEKLSRWFTESSSKLSLVKYGWANISDAGTIAHGLGVKPAYVSITPSGASPIVCSCIVDATNITVYHTSPDAETFSWQVRDVPVTVT